MITLRNMVLCTGWLALAACSDAEKDLADAPSDAATTSDAGGSILDAGQNGGFAAEGADVANDASKQSPKDADAARSSLCPPREERGIVDVPPGILLDELTHWTCDNIYVLNGIVFVHAPAGDAPQVLTIEPGTLIMGQAASSARGFLVVTRNGRIEAEGTLHDPIVFTSANPVGSRAREDWGGITLLGSASTGGNRRVEGFPSTVAGLDIDPLLAYGPRPADDAGVGTPDEAHDCGTLRYVRVEFASYNAGGGMGNESNAVQAYACGWATDVDYLQTHLSGDDGIEIFGGTLDLRHLVVTGASDDSLDWDDGWRGRAQFVVAQQYSDAADLGFEAGGSGDDPALAPNPRVFNATLVGTNGAGMGKVGGRLRGGSLGYLRNVIVLGFSSGALDIGGARAAQNFRDGSLSIQNSLFYRAGATTTFPLGAEDTPDDASATADVPDFLDEAVELTATARENQAADPRLQAAFDVRSPSFMPLPGAPLGSPFAERPSEAKGETRPPFFDPSADYVGALEPGGSDWTAGWTAYPAD